MRRLAIAAALILPLLALLALLGYGFTVEPRYIPSPLLGHPAPAFTLPLFDGTTLRLADLRGRVVLVNFWASWCLPCRDEAPALEAAWQRHKERGAVFVGINIQDEESRARDFIREFGVTYPNGIDAGGRIAVDYGLWGIPETFFIDPQGRISYKQVGALEADTITAKLEEAQRGVPSSSEGRGAYQSTR